MLNNESRDASRRNTRNTRNTGFGGYQPDADELQFKSLNFDPYAEMTEKFTRAQLIDFIK
jgi:hypothetical protein